MLRSLLLSLSTALMLIPVADATQVYVCKDDRGRTLFSQKPCPAEYTDSQVKNVEYQPGLSFDDASERRKAAADSVAANNERLSLERMVSKAGATIVKLKQERDSLISEKMGLASSLGGPNASGRGKAIVDELNATIQGYQDRINQQIELQTQGESRLKALNSDR